MKEIERPDPQSEIHQHGEIITGNVQNLSDAQVIGIGEAHPYHTWASIKTAEGRKQQHGIKAETEWFLNNYLQKGDILLLEGASKGLWGSLLAKFVARIFYPKLPKGVKIRGWDDMKAHREAGRQIKRFNNPTVGVDILKQAQEVSAEGDATNLLQQAKARKEERDDQLAEVDKVSIHQRNLSLVNRIQRMQSLYPGKRIVFVAGRSHLTPQLASEIGNLMTPGIEQNTKFAFIATNATKSQDREEGIRDVLRGNPKARANPFLGPLLER